MATDLFDNIKRPISDEFIEIGQPTFVELIWAYNNTISPTIGNSTPDVNIALNKLAFGKQSIARKQPTSTLITPESTPSDVYTIGSNIAHTQEIQNLSIAKSTTEFHSLTNNSSILALEDECPQLRNDPCESKSGDVCAVDFAIVIDDTGSMGNAIDAVKTGINEVVDLLRTTIGNNIRFSLMTFKDDINCRTPFTDLCGDDSFNAFKESLAKVKVSAGPSASAAAALLSAQGACGKWRDGDDVVRAMVLITDVPRESCGLNFNKCIKAIDGAEEAAKCDIRIAYVGMPGDPDEGIIYADTTNGINIQLPEYGGGLVNLLQTFIFSLCAPHIPLAECDGGTNIVLNGTFNTNINGWSTNGSVLWDGVFESPGDADVIANSMRLEKGASANQEYNNLNPNDIIMLNYNWCLRPNPSTLPVDTAQTIIGELRDSANNKIDVINGSETTSHTVTSPDCSSGRNSRPPVMARIPKDGIIKVHFELSGAISPSTHFLYIDQVVVCVLANEDCGHGARNLVLNGNFENGVEEWTDKNDVPLSPTDPNIWDDDIFAIIVNLTETKEVRQTILNLSPKKELSLNFEIASHEPDAIAELELQYGILNSSDVVLMSSSITNAELQSTPQRLSINFIVPNDGIIKIYFKTGAIGGITKIRNILICDISGICENEFNKISYDDFSNDTGLWVGGRYDSVGEQVILHQSDGIIIQPFPNLTPGATFQLSVNIKTAGGAILTLFSDSEAVQIFTPTSQGYYTASIIIQDSGYVLAQIRRQGPIDINIDDILVCVSEPYLCDGSISNTQMLIEWDGIPRTPTNIFNVIAKYTIRNPNYPYNTTKMTYAATSEGRLSINTCDLWKSQTASDNTLGIGLNNINTIEDQDIINIITKTDWLWSIPQNIGMAQDNLIINFPNPGPDKLIENIEFLFLTNNITPLETTTPVYMAPLGCGPDPALKFNITLRFTNSLGLNREFNTNISVTDLLNQEADFDIGNPWDTNTATGNGLKGLSARWESTSFNLDAVDGRGLDQCTVPLFFNGIGAGQLIFSKFQLSGNGRFVDACTSEVIVEDITPGIATNELQSIMLPNPTGGTWDLSWTRSGITETAVLAWDATADEIQLQLVGLIIIGANNITVGGDGTSNNPFILEFINDLSATNHDKLVADGLNLTGAATAFAMTKYDGTSNERKTISNPLNNRQDLTISFGGATSIPIQYGASIDTVDAALEGMDSIRDYNVKVTGNTSNIDDYYTGPYYIEFMNDLGNQNVPDMTAQPDQYQIITDWNGGPQNGQNDTQLIKINAHGGTFNIRVFNEDSSEFADTAQIPYNASAEIIENAIFDAADFIDITSADVNVTAILLDEANNTFIWEVIFSGTYARIDMPQIQVDNTNLSGANIITNTLRDGYGASESQRVTIIRASAGSFTLTIAIDDINHTTTDIVWNTTADGIETLLSALPPFETGDISVTNLPTESEEQNLRVIVTFKEKFGNIPTMIPDFQTTLLCDPIVLQHVNSGPYKYEIPKCDELDDLIKLGSVFDSVFDPVFGNGIEPGTELWINSLSCQSGPLLCRPSSDIISKESSDNACCDTNTIQNNISTQIKLERELFDPNTKKTIKDLILSKGLNSSDYVPYICDFNTDKLLKTSYNTIINTKMSILLIENELNTTNGRTRIIDRIANHRGTLPTRFVWPNNYISQFSVY